MPHLTSPVPVKSGSKDFPSGGKEHPSRSCARREVKMGMTNIHKQNTGRTSVTGDWSLRIMGLTRVLAGILLLVLLHNPMPVLGVTLPSTYSVTLAWQPSSSPGATGYRVYYGPACGNYTNSVLVGNVTTNTVSGLASGVTYYFAITSVAAGGQESPFSNEISFVPGVQTVRIHTASANQFVLTVSGLIGHTYQIQATQDFKTWTTIGTVTMGAGGSLDFTDTNAASYPHRFYRTQG